MNRSKATLLQMVYNALKEQRDTAFEHMENCIRRNDHETAKFYRSFCTDTEEEMEKVHQRIESALAE